MSKLILHNDKIIIQDWSYNTTQKDFRDIVKKTLFYIKNKGTINLISNTKQQKPIELLDIDYALNVLDNYFHQGLKKMAFVCPDNVFTEILVERFINCSKKNTIKKFDTIELAEEWLLAIN